MYGFPADLDLSTAIGKETTQLRVGAYDLQFSFGPVSFAIQSKVEIFRDETVLGTWEAGQWPEAIFYQMFNVPLVSFSVLDKERLKLHLGNGLAVVLTDNSEQYESMQIYIEGLPGAFII